MNGRTIQRAAVLAVAVAVLVWLALSYADAHRIREVQKVAASPAASRAQLESALDEAQKSRPLDPGTGAEALAYAASLEIRLGRTNAALGAL
jgi:hypothetical protein